MTKKYQATINACFIGYITQAIVNNFVPLLFLTFQTSYSIPLSKITFLVTINFVVQLIVDIIAIKFVDKVGYRISMVLAHIFVVIGLLSLTILPDLLTDPFIGIVISVTIYAIGGGLLEVLVSPVMESCPTENKEKAMSLLHSFYCWGHVGVVLLSTAFFYFIGISHWKILAVLWTLIPLGNAILFSKVPMSSLIEEDEEGMPLKKLLSNKLLWILLLMMMCAGACEQAVSQWASTFAETGLNVSKTIGDLAGPMTFALLMGLSRAFYGKYGDRINLTRFMSLSTLLCLFSYLLISLSPTPAFSLVGCGLTGLSVGILWPGTFSTSAESLPKGGTAMFALLALAGDIGCSTGPTLVGMVSSRANDNLKMGILSAIIFPILLFILIILCKNFRKSSQKHKKVDGV